MAPKSGPQNCPQCGAYAPAGQKFCRGCGQVLNFCVICGATNLAWSGFCHNCGTRLVARSPPAPTPVTSRPKPAVPRPTVDRKETTDGKVLKYLEEHHGEISINKGSKELGISELELVESLNRLSAKGSIDRERAPVIERMRICSSCKKVIAEGERFCSYCGRKQDILRAEPQASLDPHTLKVTLTMLSRITEAKEHSEYSSIDQLTTLIADVALGKEKPHDAQELSFSDQLRLLTLVFEYARDKVGYKGETFGEYVRWPWETIKTGGDCDCKVVLLASMLASLAFRRMHLLVLPGGAYADIHQGLDRHVQGHAILEAELADKGRTVPIRLDPSCGDCDVDEISDSIRPLLPNFYRIPILR